MQLVSQKSRFGYQYLHCKVEVNEATVAEINLYEDLLSVQHRIPLGSL